MEWNTTTLKDRCTSIGFVEFSRHINTTEKTLSKVWKYVRSKLIAWLMLSHKLIEIKLYSFYDFGRGSEIYPNNNFAIVS